MKTYKDISPADMLKASEVCAVSAADDLNRGEIASIMNAATRILKNTCLRAGKQTERHNDLVARVREFEKEHPHDGYFAVQMGFLTAMADEIERLQATKRRMDWLADKDNKIGNVQLPTECVFNNMDRLENAIDAAMALPQTP